MTACPSLCKSACGVPRIHGCGRSVAIAGFKFTLTARLYRGMLWGIAGLFIVLFTASALAAPAENRDDLLKLPESLSGAEPSPKIPPSEVLITTADDILGEMVNLNR